MFDFEKKEKVEEKQCPDLIELVVDASCLNLFENFRKGPEDPKLVPPLVVNVVDDDSNLPLESPKLIRQSGYYGTP